MANQKMISVKVYEDILERFDGILTDDKRNQAINKAMEVYIDLIKTREKIDQETENIGEASAMMVDFFKRVRAITKCWRIR